MRPIPLPIHSYNDPSVSPARLVNCYAEATVSGKSPIALLGPPGIAPFATLSAQEGRGLYVMRGSLYAVSGENMYRIDETGQTTFLGITPGSGKLTFAGNGTDIVMSNRYRLSAGSVSIIADADLPAINAVDFLDGYILFTESGSGRFGSSMLYDAASYDPLMYATAESDPSDLVTLICDHQQIILMGQTNTELWWNSAAGNFPFSRLSGGVIAYGALSILGRCKQDNSVFWLASDKTIRRISGQTPERKSQHGMEKKLTSYARLDDCIAFSYTWNGHLFAAFRFPTAGACWVHDSTTNEWHERATYGSSTWDVIDSAECYGKVFMQSASTGDIGYLSDSVHSEFGAPLRYEWTYPQVYQANGELFHGALELVAKTGGAPSGAVPYVLLELSDDGGNTWRAMPQRELGRQGDYAHVVRWNRLGKAHDRVYRCSIQNASVPMTISDTVLEVE